MVSQISEEQRQTLREAEEDWLESLAEFLEEELGDSEGNRRTVLRQARKLASGNGILHPYCDEEQWFMKGVQHTTKSSS